jgi:NitT/TauT family transport system substrate-binding protein
MALSLAIGVAPAIAQDKVAIGMSIGVNQVPTIVAKAKGFFKQEGIDVDLKPVGRGGIAIEAVAAGSLQFAESAHAPFFAAIDKGIPLHGVAVAARGFYGRMIASNANANLKSLEDFKGKRVGTQVGTGMHAVIQMLLERKGLKDSDLGITNIRVSDMPAAMATGKTFDAVIGWDPAMQRIIKGGFGKEVISVEQFMKLAEVTYPFILSAKKDYVDANPSIVQRVVNAYAKAHKFARENKEETLKIYLADLRSTGNKLDEETVRLMTYDVNRFGGPAINDLDMKDNVATLAFMLKQKQLRGKLDLTKVLSLEFGKKAEAALK